MQRGALPIFIIILFLVVATATGGLYYTLQTKSPAESPTSLDRIIPSPVQESNVPIPDNSQTPSPTKTPSPVAKKTSSPTPKPSTSSCGVNFLADSNNTFAVKLVYSATSSNGSYMTAAQWDFEGNGSWDTDLSQVNGMITHTYPSGGTYSPKLQLKMSDGSMTPICSGSVTVPYGFTVKLTGTVFEDINCNNMREPNERGLSGVTVAITNIEDYSNLATLTTNSSGYYEFSRVLAPGNGITVSPYDYPLENYGTDNDHTITLNQAQPSINMDLAQVPAPVADYCN